ncbi:fido (protein-threonine AMPylation protein) [Pseudacidovorax sp. 1753]|uniref:Fic family protein n=1 Tax=Pseudacidovorax sp. 1753 TaxID=3156419 RepID=UPI0033910448
MSGWKYESHPKAASVALRCAKILADADGDDLAKFSYLSSTRTWHRFLFEEVVHSRNSGYAGNYRGSNFFYLIAYEVSFGKKGDPPDPAKQGKRAAEVARAMVDLHRSLISEIGKLRIEFAQNQNLTIENKLQAWSRMTATFFAEFLAIHPYANGNGHMSRLLVWCLFRMAGLRCVIWNVPTRNAWPTDEAIFLFRKGNKQPLIDAFHMLALQESGFTKN